MELSGFGVRSKMWIDVYVQALYQSFYSDKPFEVMQSNTEMAIRIQITSAMVSSGKLTRNFNSGFERSAGANLEALRPRIEKFKSYLSDQIVEKDVFNLIYNPADASVYVYKNDELKGTVPGIDFKIALFGIWLSNNPVDEQLKKGRVYFLKLPITPASNSFTSYFPSSLNPILTITKSRDGIINTFCPW